VIASAVDDALSDHGARVTNIPLSPSAILELLRS
jgi:hypothetical protein